MNRSLPASSPTICDLRCEDRVNPIGLGRLTPRLAWSVADHAKGIDAFELRVAATAENLFRDGHLLWSTTVEHAAGPFVTYTGPSLQSRQRCYWAVRPVSGAQNASSWSEPASWEMGLLDRSDWTGRWIGARQPKGKTGVPYLRRSFRLEGDRVTTARAYVTALGVYELFINGHRVSEDRLAPGWTDYHKRVSYQAYDVTEHLKPGDNTVGLMLAEGWYCGLLGWVKFGRREAFGSAPPRALLQLETWDDDGRAQRVVSDEDWVYRPSPIVASSLYLGETWDLRRDAPGWAEPRVDNRGWQPVDVFPDHDAELSAQPDPPIRVTERVEPAAITEPSPGVYVVDFGQNIAGVCELRTAGASGTEVTIRHAEMLDTAGYVDTRNLRAAVSIDRFILDGGEATLSPRFTYHGFRYAQVEGLAQPLRPTDIAALVMHSDCAPTLDFECGEPTIRRIHDMVVWSQRDNMYGMLTDCPQRDERFGWFGDAGAFAPAACQNFQINTLLTKFNRDLHDSQNPDGSLPDFAPFVPLGEDVVPRSGTPGYMDAVTLFPWAVYWYYGDQRILEDSLDAMVAYLRFADPRCPEGLWTGRRGNDYADWIATRKSDPVAIATLLIARSAKLTAQAAKIVGRTDEARYAAALAERAAAGFNRAYLSAGRYPDATQAILAMALDYGVAPPEHTLSIAEQLAEEVAERGGRLDTGIHGTAALLPALSAHGHHDTALRIVRQRRRPSWGYMIDQGATTLWERWMSDALNRGGMNSQNHVAFGSVSAWLLNHLVGIQAETPGYRRVRFQPGATADGAVPSASATYRSVSGPVGCAWRLEPQQLHLELKLPATCSGELVLRQERGFMLSGCLEALEQQPGFAPPRIDNGQVRADLQPGRYRLILPMLQKQPSANHVRSPHVGVTVVPQHATPHKKAQKLEPLSE